MQPTAFVQMMSGGAADGIVFAGPSHGREEFRDDESIGRFFDVFAEGPPAEVIDFFKAFVRTLEEGNILSHEPPRARVADELRIQLSIGLIEGIKVMFEITGSEDGAEKI